MKQIVLAMVFVMLAGVMAQAQGASVPPLVNYQGMLTDASGKPLTGSKKIEFSLYDAATNGNKVWGPQIFSSVPLVNGMFNVILGTTDTEGRSITEAFGGKDRYIGIKVDDGAELAPRQQILSAPFAIAAGTVQGRNLYVDPESGNVGIGTTNPGEKLEVVGKIKASNLGKVLQVVHSQSNEFVSSDQAIPWDDTIPQQTEGIEVLTVTITPENASSKLLVEACIHTVEEADTSDHVMVAIFKDSDFDAIATAVEEQYGPYNSWGSNCHCKPPPYTYSGNFRSHSVQTPGRA
ncbi:MAG: hypothetical protein DRI57_22495 [Deltaproteobacteria bacterium]|nr:MAG: hypothetical protein DRI57_22495 [Deltaproteobacteria bacterium]